MTATIDVGETFDALGARACALLLRMRASAECPVMPTLLELLDTTAADVAADLRMEATASGAPARRAVRSDDVREDVRTDDAAPSRTAFALAHAALGAALEPAETLKSLHGSRRRDRTTLVGVTATRLIVTHVERTIGEYAAHRCWTRALPLAESYE